MNKSRILLVSEYYVPHWTGIVVTFHEIAKSLILQGHDVTVLTTQYDHNLSKKETIDGVKVIRAPFLMRLSRTHYSIEILYEFMQICSKFETVVINSPNSNILFFTILAKIFRKKVVIYHQGDLILPSLSGNQIVNRLLEWVFDLVTIPSFILCDRAMTYTLDYAENSRVMRYSVNKFKAYIPRLLLPVTKPSRDFVDKTRRLKGRILIGFAGRFVEEKGYDYLLKAIPEIIKHYKNAKFVFAGSTNMDYEPFFEKNKNLIEKNKKHLVFLGLLSRDDLKHFYKMLDVFVISSRSDCFPTTQIEVALEGVPIVVTDIPGARMLVKVTKFGEVVKTHSPTELENGIIKILKNKVKYMGYSKNVLKFIKKYDTFQPFN